MKSVSAPLAAHLAGPATTLARLWTATRRDGAVFGFTDHDQDLTVSGVTYRAASGLGQSDTVAATGLATGGQDIMGALSSDAITEADILAGLWDGAVIEVWLVNWADVSQLLHQATHTIGEVIRRDGGFTAELRGQAHRLDQPTGRLYQHRCDADLGDARCGLTLAGSSFAATGSVTATLSARLIAVSGLDAFTLGLFDRGRLQFTSGTNAGRAMEVKAEMVVGGQRQIELWQPMVGPIAPGDGFTITAGCDKRFETCRDRFANALNFRGFPHIPGSDYAIGSPATSHVHDGGALMP